LGQILALSTAQLGLQTPIGAAAARPAPPLLAPASAITAAQPVLSARGAVMTPAAMTVLLQAQEDVAQGASSADRVRSVAKIDQLISRMTEPGAAPATASGFSMQRLLAARQQLRQTFA
jgi:hypothetical protein